MDRFGWIDESQATSASSSFSFSAAAAVACRQLTAVIACARGMDHIDASYGRAYVCVSTHSKYFKVCELVLIYVCGSRF